MKPIGPSFPYELDAAGIVDRRFSWGTDGVIQFDPLVPQAVRDAVLAVYAAHDPARPAPEPKVMALRRQIQAALTDPSVPGTIKAVLAALRDTLP